jgi:hypothetical protein
MLPRDRAGAPKIGDESSVGAADGGEAGGAPT